MAEVHLFVVRVWELDGRFCASVRAADDDEPRLFDAPEHLADFLRRAAHAPGAAADDSPRT
jgi:hypothetical protein